MDVLDAREGSDYIAHIDFIPPSPPRDPSDLPDYLYDNPSFHTQHNPDGTLGLNASNNNNNPHTPSYNGSYFGSPYSQHSELSFSADDINFELLSEIAGMDNNTYEPSEYDGPSASNVGGGMNTASSNAGPGSNSLLMYTQDSDYMSPHFSPDAMGAGGAGASTTSRRGSPFDHSSPSSNGDLGDMNAMGGGGGSPFGGDAGAGRHSRASSVGSNHRSPVPSPSPQPNLSGNNNGSPFQPQASPRLDVAQSFGNMSVHTPSWGQQALPTHSPNLRGHSPLPLPQNKPMSPPRLLMPETSFDGSSSSVLGLDIQQGQDNLLTAVPKINAPDGGANGSGNGNGHGDDDMNGGGGQGGPSFHIVPATPIGGAGDGHQNNFQAMATITQGAELGAADQHRQQQQQQQHATQLNLNVHHSQPPSRQASPYTPPSRLSPAPQHQQQQNAASTSNNTSNNNNNNNNTTGGFIFPDTTPVSMQQQQQQEEEQARSRRNSNTNAPPDWASYDYQQQQQIVQQQQQAQAQAQAQQAQAQAQQQQQQQRIHQAQLQSFTFGGSSSGGNNNNNNNPNGSPNPNTNHFLSPDLGGLGASTMRRSISDQGAGGVRGAGHRLSRSEDIRLPGVGGFANNAGGAVGGGAHGNNGLGPAYQPNHGQSSSLSLSGAPFPDYGGQHHNQQQHNQHQQQGSAQFLHPLHFPSSSASGSPLPPIRRSLSPGLPGPFGGPPGVGVGAGIGVGVPVNVGHFRRASSGTRSDRGAEVWGSQAPALGHGHGMHAHQLSVAQRRVSPYPSPNASPRVRYEELADDGVGVGGMQGGMQGMGMQGGMGGMGMQGGMVQDDGLLGVGVGMGGGLGLGLGLPGLGVSGLSGPGLSLGPGTIASGVGGGGVGGGAGQAMGLGHPGLGEIGEQPVSGGFSEEIPITGRGTYANHPSLVNDGASSQGGGRGRAGSATSAEGGGIGPGNVAKQNVTTGRTANASIRRRKQDANFACTVPGCNSTFTRGFNLKGHLRSHYEQKPYKCHWPGCGKGFARQHDCKRHEQLHSNFRPFECEGCKKQFARMDALNRHLRSEAGGECLRVVAERGGSAAAASLAAAAAAGAGAGGGRSASPGSSNGGGGGMQDVGMDEGYGEDVKQPEVVTTRSGRQVARRKMTGAMDEDAWSGVAL